MAVGSVETTKKKEFEPWNRGDVKKRRAKVIQFKGLGLRVGEISKLMGITENQINSDVQALKDADPILAERLKHQALFPLARACVIANLENGNMEAAKPLFKGTGVWRDKVDVIVEKKLTDDEMKEKATQLLAEIRGRTSPPDRPEVEPLDNTLPYVPPNDKTPPVQPKEAILSDSMAVKQEGDSPE